MKLLKQLVFITALVAGFALTAAAQRPDEGRQKPPKDNAEIKPEDKKPKNNENRNNENRNNENKGKKPQTYFLLSRNLIEINTV